MSFTRRALLIAALVLACVATSRAGEEKKPASTNQPPIITMALPFAIGPGTNKVLVRGVNITNATAVRFVNSNETAAAHFISWGKANLPDKADPKKHGDVQVELLLTLNDATPRDLAFVLTTPDGHSNTNTLRVLSAPALDEKEPNGSLKKPQPIADATFIRGTIDPANDVDVFSFVAMAGEKFLITTTSTPYGSTLDPILTLYDSAAHLLATSDDADGKDAALKFTAPATGEYRFAVTDAHDRAGLGNMYLIELRTAR